MYADCQRRKNCMARKLNRKLILENGSEYLGYSFGANTEKVCELVFNTSMVGYQEIVSDPSYTDQAVVMTYPLIGNYGITDEDFESRASTLGALVVCEYNDTPSNFRCTKTLSEILEEFDVPAMEGIDTRKLAKELRDNGTMRALITDAKTSKEDGLEKIKSTPVRRDAVSRVSCRKRYFSRTPDHIYNVVAIDCGIRLSTIKALNLRDCNVTVVPYNTDAQSIRGLKPDCVLVSNGPGSPDEIPETVAVVNELRGKVPLFGIGMGMQVISLAYGAKTYSLKFGHRGGNHPIRHIESGKIRMASQSHGYAVCERSVENTALIVTHKNVLDGTVEGVMCDAEKAYAVQFSPDTTVGSGDENNFFDLMVKCMKGAKKNA